MDDLISRQAAIDALGERPAVWTDSDYEIAQRNQWDIDKLAIETVPSADVVEVVRCKDCENWDTEWNPKGGGHYCGMIDLVTSEMFYCTFGERRTDESN